MITAATVLGLGAPAVAVLLHALIYRLAPGLKNFPRQKLAILVILGAAGVTVAEAVYLGLSVEQQLHAGLLALMLGYSYFHFFNMSETARRIRILVAHVANLPQAQDSYDAGKIYGNRLVRMREHNMIIEENGKLKVKNGPMLWASYIIVFWRKLFYP